MCVLCMAIYARVCYQYGNIFAISLLMHPEGRRYYAVRCVRVCVWDAESIQNSNSEYRVQISSGRPKADE